MNESTNRLSLNVRIERIQLPGFVADDDDPQPMPNLELRKPTESSRIRFRLRKHEAPELSQVNDRF